MGNATRHVSERFHLLRLTQLRVETVALHLRSLALAHVPEETDSAYRSPIGKPNHFAGVFHIKPDAVLAPHAIFEDVTVGLGPTALQPAEIIGMHACQQCRRIAQLVREEAEDLAS